MGRDAARNSSHRGKSAIQYVRCPGAGLVRICGNLRPRLHLSHPPVTPRRLRNRALSHGSPSGRTPHSTPLTGSGNGTKTALCRAPAPQAMYPTSGNPQFTVHRTLTAHTRTRTTHTISPTHLANRRILDARRLIPHSHTRDRSPTRCLSDCTRNSDNARAESASAAAAGQPSGRSPRTRA